MKKPSTIDINLNHNVKYNLNFWKRVAKESEAKIIVFVHAYEGEGSVKLSIEKSIKELKQIGTLYTKYKLIKQSDNDENDNDESDNDDQVDNQDNESKKLLKKYFSTNFNAEISVKFSVDSFSIYFTNESDDNETFIVIGQCFGFTRKDITDCFGQNFEIDSTYVDPIRIKSTSAKYKHTCRIDCGFYDKISNFGFHVSDQLTKNAEPGDQQFRYYLIYIFSVGESTNYNLSFILIDRIENFARVVHQLIKSMNLYAKDRKDEARKLLQNLGIFGIIDEMKVDSNLNVRIDSGSYEYSEIGCTGAYQQDVEKVMNTLLRCGAKSTGVTYSNFLANLLL